MPLFLFLFVLFVGACHSTLSDQAVRGTRGAVVSDARLIFGVDAPNATLRGVSADVAARAHIAEHLDVYRVSAKALDTLRVVHVRKLHEETQLVQLRQVIGGVDAFHSELKVLLGANNRLLGLSGTLYDAPRRPTFVWSKERALAFAISDRSERALEESDVSELQPHAGFAQFLLHAHSPVVLRGAARVKPVLFPQGSSLVPAYITEFELDHLYQTIVSAEDGVILSRTDRTFSYSYDVRVQGPDARPADGPYGDYTPHPTGLPDHLKPSVLEVTQNVTPPGNQHGDPWIPDEVANKTLGNNVSAYADWDAIDGLSSTERNAPATNGHFVDSYDFDQDPFGPGNAVVDNQMDSSIINAFYVTNWLHDDWYDAGFDEAAGNAQQDNYGRGGEDEDRMLVEVQDRLTLLDNVNNANMYVPSDGAPPRMQMYIFYSANMATVTLAGDELFARLAYFAPDTAGTSAAAVLAMATSCTPAPCFAVSNGAALAGNIALMARSDVASAKMQALAAQEAGAAGAIIFNTQPPDLKADRLDDDPAVVAAITIPVFNVSYVVGAALQAALPIATLTMKSEWGKWLDGGFDNGIIAHEFGHFLHLRLQNCGTWQCAAMGEGWGDFLALHMTLRAGDDLFGTFTAGGAYSSPAFSQDAIYYGGRRYPSSINPSKNPLTFRWVADDAGALPTAVPPAFDYGEHSEVHNAGEIWATALFEVYVSLLQQPGADFGTVRRQFAKYIVQGLQFAPTDSTFTEMRDALLTVILARSRADFDVATAAFARRGLGSCANSPARNVKEGSVTGVVESFTLLPRLHIGALSLSVDGKSCDGDTLLDSQESGTLSIEVFNVGSVASTGSTLVITHDVSELTPATPTTVPVPDLPALGKAVVLVPMALRRDISSAIKAQISVQANNAGACEVTTPARTLSLRLNEDSVPAATALDDTESSLEAWTATGGTGVWSIQDTDKNNRVRVGANLGVVSDSALTSPSLLVGTTGPLVVSFKHRFSFDYSFDTVDHYWDGGVVELSVDNGASWQDATAFGATPTYLGQIGSARNALVDRMAYAHQNAAYPEYDVETLTFTHASLAGASVLLRFRIATDEYDSDEGWSIDDVDISGINNTPFPKVVADASVCNDAPVANAGADLAVDSGATVTLDASASTDADGDILSFVWTQTAGDAQTLTDAATKLAQFTAPVVSVDTAYTFSVQASDGVVSSSDSATVTVKAASEPTAEEKPSSKSGCSCGAEPNVFSAAFWAVIFFAWRRRAKLVGAPAL